MLSCRRVWYPPCQYHILVQVRSGTAAGLVPVATHAVGVAAGPRQHLALDLTLAVAHERSAPKRPRE
eukprot:275227-Rhodomonas_salina.1